MDKRLWAQDNFSKGELSPLMYARVTTRPYFNGSKTARNVIPTPQGALKKRFGSLFRSYISQIKNIDHRFVRFESFVFLNQCTYQILIYPGHIRIYLEGLIVSSIATSTIKTDDMPTLRHCIIDNRFRIARRSHRPTDLKRAENSVAVTPTISSPKFDITVSSPPIGAPLTIYPVKFYSGTGTLPTTTPQIRESVTYFIKTSATGTTVRVYETSKKAKNGNDPILFNTQGTGNRNFKIQNQWSLVNVGFKHPPTHDFKDVNYNAITFTISGTTLTASAAVFTTEHVGGVFIAFAGGTASILTRASATSVTIEIINTFGSTTSFKGRNVYLAETAWNAKRGWPNVCASYQSRAFFGNTATLPGGLWGSAINDFSDFSQYDVDPTDSVSYFPNASNASVINFISPYKSLTVQMGTGIFSTGSDVERAITPTTFSMYLQDSISGITLQPKDIDNQLVMVAGDNVFSLIWDNTLSAYQSSAISVMSEHLIRNPADEDTYQSMEGIATNYTFITNDDGTMAIYQSLLSEEVSGWTLASLYQQNGQAKYRKAASDKDGRCWFLTQRQVPTRTPSSFSITGFSSSLNAFNVPSTSISTTVPVAVKFAINASTPLVTSPQIVVGTQYWAIQVSTGYIQIYLTQEDALKKEAAIVINNAGTGNSITTYPLSYDYFIEELSNDVRLDFAIEYEGTPISTISNLIYHNTQDVKAIGDGYGFEGLVFDNEFTFDSYGSNQEVSKAYVGYPIQSQVEPLPLSFLTATAANSTNLLDPKHIRAAKFMFSDTIGGTINNKPIALNTTNQFSIGEPPKPARGFVEMALMHGWEDFNNPSWSFLHNDPFDFTLLGVFYTVDI
jgi:hypothetical protein